MSERHEPFGRPVTRRRLLLAALGGAGVLAGGSYALARALSSDSGTTAAPLEPPDRLAELAGSIQSGGPP